jgi:hypothetical protein
LLGLCLVVAGLGTLAVFEFFVWNKVPPELVGYWEVTEGPQKGGTFEFFREGRMEVRLKSKKRTVTHKAPIVVRGKTLVEIARQPLTGDETASQSIIHELTAQTLILESERGDVLSMVRIE